MEILENGLKEFGLLLSDRQKEAFQKYYDLLIEWNGFMNLTAITEFDEVCLKHFLDSISLCKAIDCNKAIKLIDIGTGAGFPSIPLKIMFPKLKITMLDSLGKRVRFLNEVIKVLDLNDICALHSRAEDLALKNDYRECFDVCVSRAVANLSTLSEYCLPYVKKNGFFVSYKSEKISDEIKTAKRAIEILGGEIYDQIEFNLPESDIYRNLFVIKKIKATSKKYPRKAGVPSKEPL